MALVYGRDLVGVSKQVYHQGRTRRKQIKHQIGLMIKASNLLVRDRSVQINRNRRSLSGHHNGVLGSSLHSHGLCLEGTGHQFRHCEKLVADSIILQSGR